MKKSLLTAIMLGSFALGAMEFRIETERGNEISSWRRSIDAAAIGGKFIFAQQKGADQVASGSFSCPVADKYYVWVRSYTHGEHWRKTQININGKKIGTFGDDGPKLAQPKWEWKRTLGPCRLEEGEFKIEFIPLAMYCRVDCLIFTTNQNFTPPESRDAVEEIEELDCE